MVEVSETILLLAATVIFVINGIGAHFSALYGSPRAYYIMSSLIAYFLAAAVIIIGPQI